MNPFRKCCDLTFNCHNYDEKSDIYNNTTTQHIHNNYVICDGAQSRKFICVDVEWKDEDLMSDFSKLCVNQL